MASAIDTTGEAGRRRGRLGRRDHSAPERILAAAIDVFGTFGFTKSTILEISARAHVSKPLFYRHYQNKQEVFEAAIERVFEEWHETLAARVRDEAVDTADSIRILFVGMLEYGRARPFLSRLLTRDSQLMLSTQSDAWDRACRALRALLGDILRRGIEVGRVRSDLPIEHMADLLTEIHFAYANRQLLSGTRVDADLADSLVEGMLGGISP